MKLTVRNSIASALTIAGASFVVFGVTGCQSPGASTDFHVIAAEPTPELQGVTERRIDVDRHLAITHDLNKRNFSDDLGRFFYTDHPSRMSPWPVMYTSGIPR